MTNLDLPDPALGRSGGFGRAVVKRRKVRHERRMVSTESLTRLAEFSLSEADVMRRTWSFGKLGHAPYSAHVKLLPKGGIGGHQVETERYWRIEDGQVVLLDRIDRRSVIFDDVFVNAEGRLTLVGDFRLVGGGDSVHYLQEIAPVGAVTEQASDLVFSRRSEASKRNNLVVVRAGPGSKHLQWARDVGDDDRSWDLCSSFYGAEEDFGRDPFAEYQVYQPDTKGVALHALFHRSSPLWAYDRIAIFDDDIMASWAIINELLAICREHDLLLAQPALTPDSYFAHPITLRDEAYRLRFTSFVETMCPVFTREALRACLPTFPVSSMGFGLDNVWPKLLGEPHDRIAIVDQTPVTHTRPAASNFDLAAAVADGNALQAMFNAPSRVLELGAIFARPVDRQHIK